MLAETGGAFVHPYDDARVIAGQGTAAFELFEDVPDLDAVIAPVGGGGLMSGTCLAVRGLRPKTLLFGAEPAGADDAARSLAAGRRSPTRAGALSVVVRLRGALCGASGVGSLSYGLWRF